MIKSYLEEFWTILPETSKFFSNKKSCYRFSYLLLFQYFNHNNKFFNQLSEIPKPLIEFGLQIICPEISFEEINIFFDQNSRYIQKYKSEIRAHFGFKPFSVISQKNLLTDLSSLFYRCSNDEELKARIQEHLVYERIEVPNSEVVFNIVQKIKQREENNLFGHIFQDLSRENKNWIDQNLLTTTDSNGELCQFLRQDSGPTNAIGIKEEIDRLNILRTLPLEKFDYIKNFPKRHLSLLIRRFLSNTPQKLKDKQDIDRYALVILFFHQKAQGTVDNLGDHLLNIRLSMKKQSQRKKEKLDREVSKRLNALNNLYKIAEIARDFPKEIIENAIYAEVPREAIEEILRIKELTRTAKKAIREDFLQKYSRIHKNKIFEILSPLEICSQNKEFMEALSYIKTHSKSRSEFYPLDEEPSLEVISQKDKKIVVQKDSKGQERISRKDYECALFKELSKKLSHKEVWIKGAFKYRNPSEDLPNDFEENKVAYYENLNLPLDGKEFIKKTRQKMEENLTLLDQNSPKNPYVKITTKKGKTWIQLSPLEKQIEPKNVQNLKDAVLSKWNIIDLIDILKEVDLREDIFKCFSTAGNRKILDQNTLRKRILLCLFALGTNTGLKRASGASSGKITFEELRHIKRLFINKEDLRDCISKVVNSILKMRDPIIWGEATTACAADSKKFGAFDQNLMAQWHPRYHGKGVMIYWHVNSQYLCVYSQLKTCTSSEVASMLQGVISQGTDMDIDSQYVDSHGKSELGFSLTHLLGFDLLPRYKTIGSQKLFLPSDDFKVKNINSITTRSIDWELIESQYDEMVKHAAALKTTTSTAEAIIRKFSRSHYSHPTFKAFLELGKVIKTIFLCRYLHSVEMRQEINAGLNVVENWNSAIGFIHYGKSGEMTTNSPGEQEISMLCLHLLQVCITYINTLFVQRLFKEGKWFNRFQEEDFRALTPLFYHHINPYGTFTIDLKNRLQIEEAA
jgi:TnpA family transposase